MQAGPGGHRGCGCHLHQRTRPRSRVRNDPWPRAPVRPAPECTRHGMWRSTTERRAVFCGWFLAGGFKSKPAP